MMNLKKDPVQLVYEVLIILLISSSLAYGKIWRKLKYLAIWAGIFFIMMAGYSYRFELGGFRDKVLAEFVPAKGFQDKPNSVSFPLSSDGHFYIRADLGMTFFKRMKSYEVKNDILTLYWGGQ